MFLYNVRPLGSGVLKARVAAKKTRRSGDSDARKLARSRARAAGIGKRLTKWLKANERDPENQVLAYLPVNANQLCNVLREIENENLHPSEIKRWLSGEQLPNARYLPYLEEFLGRRGIELDDHAARRWKAYVRRTEDELRRVAKRAEKVLRHRKGTKPNAKGGK